jgi:serine/threonine protein phosphatase PrpC
MTSFQETTLSSLPEHASSLPINIAFPKKDANFLTDKINSTFQKNLQDDPCPSKSQVMTPRKTLAPYGNLSPEDLGLHLGDLRLDQAAISPTLPYTPTESPSFELKTSPPTSDSSIPFSINLNTIEQQTLSDKVMSMKYTSKLTPNEILTWNARCEKFSPEQLEQVLSQQFEDANSQQNLIENGNNNWEDFVNVGDPKPKELSCDDFSVPLEIEDMTKLRNHLNNEALEPALGLLGVATTQGMRPYQEDRFLASVITSKMGNEEKIFPLYAVFDGHGGQSCAEHLVEYLPETLKKDLEEADKHSSYYALQIYNTLSRAFINIGEEYRKNFQRVRYSNKVFPAGSTATLALIDKTHIWVACAGDSRAILSVDGEPIALSEDAKPEVPKYAKEVTLRGQEVRIFNEGGFIVYRVRGVDMTNAVGHDQINSGISPRATIIGYPLERLKDKRSFLIIASDGLWKTASSDQVARYAYSNDAIHVPPHIIAADFVERAFKSGGTDNITAMVIDLNGIIPS